MKIINKKPGNFGILSSGQKKALAIFFSLEESEFFCLTGGTALAEFYLGHRESFDLDFFSSREDLIVSFSRKLEKALSKSYKISVPRRFNSFVEIEAESPKEKVKVQLALESPFRLSEPKRVGNILINDYLDLIVDKALAFFGRTEPRDTVDLFFILNEDKVDFWQLVKYCQKKDPGFDLYWMAVALEKTQELPDQIGRWPVEMIKPVDAKALKEMFKKLADDIFEKINKK